jgi:hypothetical protein
MSAQRHINTIFGAVLVLGLAGAMGVSYHIEQLRKGATLKEVLYVTSPKMLKKASLGYHGLLADIYWTRAVQYFGRKHLKRESDYSLLYPLLDITTTLDPHLIPAYNFGAIFVAQQPPEGAGMPDKAVELVERGIKENPNDWHLYYGLGFIHWIERKDYAAASDAFRRGSQVPGANPALGILAAHMAAYRGDTATARYIWTQIYENTENKQIKDNAIRRLRALQVDDEVQALEMLVQRYKERMGSLPQSFNQMMQAGILRRYPVDPIGKPYKLTADGRVEVVSPEDLPFIQRGLPPGVKTTEFYQSESNEEAPAENEKTSH